MKNPDAFFTQDQDPLHDNGVMVLGPSNRIPQSIQSTSHRLKCKPSELHSNGRLEQPSDPNEKK